MTPLLLVLAASFALCLLVIPLVRCLACRIGLVDKPDSRRKTHGRIVPLAGGLSILLVTMLIVGGALVFACVFPGWWPIYDKDLSLLGLLPAALIIAVLGIVDDFGWIRGRHKLLGQIIAVGLVVGCGVRVDNVQFFGWHMELGLLAIPFTMCFLLGAINSLNLLDGMDGLLGSVGFIICLVLAAMAALSGHGTEALIAITLGGALLGFLYYNLPPASVFLGDCGSMLVGLVIGALAIQSSLKAPATIALTTPMVLLTLPFFDTIAAIVRRKLTGRSIYHTDRAHLHHCMLRRGLSVRWVLVVTSACCLLTGTSVLLSHAFGNELIALLTGVAVVGTLILTGLFGHAETMLLKERLFAIAQSLLRLNRSGETRQVHVRLQGTVDWQEFWNSLVGTAARMNLRQICLDVNSPTLQQGYHAQWHLDGVEGEFSNLWRLEVPLSAHGVDVGRLRIVGENDAFPIWEKLATITKMMQEFTDNLVQSSLFPDTPVPEELESAVPDYLDDLDEHPSGMVKIG